MARRNMRTPDEDPTALVDGQADTDTDEIDVDVSGDESLVPPGQYAAIVDALETSVSKNTGAPMLVWDFVIIDGPHRAKSLRMYTSQSPAALWRLSATLRALGFTADANGHVKFKRAEALGRACMLNVIEEEYNGEKRAAIKSVVAHPDGFKIDTTGLLF